MKYKYIITLLIFVILQTALVGCDVDIYHGRRPIDYPNTKWVCEEIDMYFTVSDTDEIYGEIIDKSGEIVKFTLLWAVGNPTVSVKSINEIDAYFVAECDFGKKEFTMKITDINDSNFDYIPKELTFKRIDLE